MYYDMIFSRGGCMKKRYLWLGVIAAIGGAFASLPREKATTDQSLNSKTSHE